MSSFTINIDDKGKTKAKSKKKAKRAIKKTQTISKDDTKKVKAEISELEAKRSRVVGGWRGILQKASINKAINDKRKFLNAKEGLRAIRAETERVEARLKLEEARGKLSDLHKKRQVNFEGFGGFGSSPKKEIRFEDLY